MVSAVAVVTGVSVVVSQTSGPVVGCGSLLASVVSDLVMADWVDVDMEVLRFEIQPIRQDARVGMGD